MESMYTTEGVGLSDVFESDSTSYLRHSFDEEYQKNDEMQFSEGLHARIRARQHATRKTSTERTKNAISEDDGDAHECFRPKEKQKSRAADGVKVWTADEWSALGDIALSAVWASKPLEYNSGDVLDDIDEDDDDGDGEEKSGEAEWWVMIACLRTALWVVPWHCVACVAFGLLESGVGVLVPLAGSSVIDSVMDERRSVLSLVLLSALCIFLKTLEAMFCNQREKVCNYVCLCMY